MRKLVGALAIGAVMAMAVPASAQVFTPSHPCHPHADPTVIVGTLFDDRLVGDHCDNTIFGLTGNDRLIGRAGEDTLAAGRGNDRLRGVDGEPDLLNGGAGRDRCVGDQFDNFRRCDTAVVIVTS